MNRIDRLFAILLRLQKESRVQAIQLAEEFAISKRTVYRDIAALNEMGVPIVSLPGEGYELMPGYYLPPLVFSEDEAAALLLGAHILQHQTRGRLPGAATSAIEKLLVALPQRSVKKVEGLRRVTTVERSRARFDLDDPIINTMNEAIQEQRVVEIDYQRYGQGQITRRQIEPVSMHYDDGLWYVNAYCRLRNDWRAFRFNRIEKISLTAELFELRPQPTPSELEKFVVRVRFAAEQARWVGERQHYAFVGEELGPTPDSIDMLYEIKRVDQLLPWLLGWGAQAQVVEPQEMVEAVREELEKTKELYD